MSVLEFPSDKDFDAVVTDVITKWGDLSKGTVYAIKAIKGIKGKYGTSVIGDLETKDGEQYKVWLPKRLGDKVKGLKLLAFVRHEGKQESNKVSCGYYYAYTVYK